MLRKLYIIITIVTLYYYYEINIILLGGFNTEPTDTALYNLKNLIKDKTCLDVVTQYLSPPLFRHDFKEPNFVTEPLFLTSDI